MSYQADKEPTPPGGLAELTAIWAGLSSSRRLQPASLGWHSLLGRLKTPQLYKMSFFITFALCLLETAMLAFSRPESQPDVAALAPVSSEPVARTAGPLRPSCARNSSQTLNSRDRDQLLYDAISAHDLGKQARALGLLRRYVDEACDNATLEAVFILESRAARAVKER
jgi:hypothetical protein